MLKVNLSSFTSIVIFCLVNCLISSISCDDCYQHHFPNGGIACACNITHCDSLAIEKTAPPGVLLSYESDITGKRFRKSLNPLDTIQANGTAQSTFIMNIDRSDVRQTMNGFGGSFTDASGINIFSLPEFMSRRLLQDYFASDGIEYSMGRFPFGCTDFSRRNYSYADVKDDFDLRHFALAPEDMQYKVSNKIVKLYQVYTIDTQSNV